MNTLFLSVQTRYLSTNRQTCESVHTLPLAVLVFIPYFVMVNYINFLCSLLDQSLKTISHNQLNKQTLCKIFLKIPPMTIGYA